MLPRQRQLAAIDHELTDRVSVDAICVENVDAIAQHLGIDSGAVHDRLGIDGRLVAAGYTGPVGEPIEGQPVNAWGSVDSGDYGTTHVAPLAGARTVAQVEAYAWPDPADYDYAAAAATARDLSPTYAVRAPYWHPLFCRACDLFGMEQAMMHMLAEPALFEAALQRVFEHVYEYCRRMLDACGDALDIFSLGDDFATQRGLMIRPDDWRRYLKPRLAKLFELGKQRGKRIWFHSCGDVTPVLGDLIDIGVDVWETVQLHALPISPETLKREYGRRLTFFGGINTQRLPFADAAQVEREVRRVIGILGRGGGYICGPDHHVKPDVPAANIVALFDAARHYRGAGVTL